jgi:signal transduction histidine kinase
LASAEHVPDYAEEFARETGEITVRRTRIGLILYLAFALIGFIVEWQHYPVRGTGLLVTYTVVVLLAAAAWLAMRNSPPHPTAAWIVLGCCGGITLVLGLYNAAVGGDMLYLLLTFIAFMFVPSMFIPWGATFQLGLNAAVIGAYAVGVAGGGRTGPVPGYDYIAIVATTVFTALGALYIDQYRRQLFRQAAALREANEQLETANRTRTELLSGLSHDMRTPLNVLIGYGDMLADSPQLMAELGSQVRGIRREARELLSLVDGVLDLARLEAGRLPFQRTTFPLAEALDPLRETTEEQLRDGRVRLRWDIAPALAIDSDPGKVREIVRNLLSNAVKYTQHGVISLVAAPARGGGEIAVADTGVGIAAEHLTLIFEAFRRVELSLGQRLDGLGFGLYMVRLLARLIGGRVDVQSTPGTGSTFRVWLPPHPPEND